MIADEKIQKIQDLEREFLARIETIKKDYQAEVRRIMDEANKKKLENLKKDLGM